MTSIDYIKTIPSRKLEKKIFKGVIYFDGRISASNGPLYASIKHKYDKSSEGKMYATDGNRIDVDIKDVAEMNYKAKSYISNKRSYTVGVDDLKRALKNASTKYIKMSEYYFSKQMLNHLIDAANILDIDFYNLSSFKEVPCLVGISQIENNVVILASMRPGKDYDDSIEFEKVKN